MLTFRWLQEVYHSYMVVDSNPSLDTNDYSLNILLHQKMPYLAPFQNRSRDGEMEYYYDITGGTSLELLAKKKISGEMLDYLAASLCGVMESIQEYLINEDDVILDITSVFGMEDGMFRFIYYPGYGQLFSSQLNIWQNRF